VIERAVTNMLAGASLAPATPATPGTANAAHAANAAITHQRRGAFRTRGILADPGVPDRHLRESGATIGRFTSTVPAAGALDRFRLVPTRANGQPALACYLRDPHAPTARAYGLMVLTLRARRAASRR
jgi:hypothetical protein